jgi:hypothetical protein
MFYMHSFYQVGWSPQLEAVATVLDRLVLAGVELDKAAAATSASLSSANQGKST